MITIAVINTHGGKQVKILDPGASMSLARRPLLDQNLKKFDLTIKDMVSWSCYQVFQFGGINKIYESKILITLPLLV